MVLKKTNMHHNELTDSSITFICFAKSFIALASPLKAVSCLKITQNKIM